MRKIKIINWTIWLILVIIWNYGYPEASPFLDVLVAIILSLLNLLLIKTIKK
ncbi:hypothetical protein OAZ96_01105 [Pelagibacteraceae bacterium]|nr:hypothetical protein [Pelagibacteraceae bacterium]|tara:strand:+ start:1087 stop:1242 length:156 start_codon:yes stop_codon:yes gene_type:complete